MNNTIQFITEPVKSAAKQMCFNEVSLKENITAMCRQVNGDIAFNILCGAVIILILNPIIRFLILKFYIKDNIERKQYLFKIKNFYSFSVNDLNDTLWVMALLLIFFAAILIKFGLSVYSLN